MKMQHLVPAALAAILLLAGNSLASPMVMVLESPDTAPGIPQPVSALDLVNDGSPALLSESSSGHVSFSGSSPDVLNDGSPGGWNLNANEGAVTTQTTPWTLTYMLNTANAPNGYEITQIEAMSLWTDDFVNQNYSVSVATTSNPVFTSLIANVTADEQDIPPGGSASSLKTVITDTTNVLASNVVGIQFLFEPQPQDYGSSFGSTLAAYKEVDVFGYASVPEPTTSLMALAACGLLGVRRRRG